MKIGTLLTHTGLWTSHNPVTKFYCSKQFPRSMGLGKCSVFIWRRCNIFWLWFPIYICSLSGYNYLQSSCMKNMHTKFQDSQILNYLARSPRSFLLHQLHIYMCMRVWVVPWAQIFFIWIKRHHLFYSSHTQRSMMRLWSVNCDRHTNWKRRETKAHSGTWPMAVLKYFWGSFPGAGNALWLWLGSLSFQMFLLFLSLFLLLKFSPHIRYTFCSSPTNFGYSLSFLFSDFVLFAFQFWRFLLIFEVSLSSHILSSATSRAPMSPSEAFFISVSVFWIYCITLLVLS